MAILVRCVAAVSALFLLAACSSSGGEQGTAVTTAVSTVTSTSAKPAAAKSSTSAAEASVAPAAKESGEGKEPLDCIFGGGNWTGTAMYSDGTYGPHPECEERRKEVLRERPYQCPRTDQLVADLDDCVNSVDPFRNSAPSRERASTRAPAPSQPAAPVASYEPVPTATAAPAPDPEPEPEPEPAPSAATGPLPATDAGY